MRESDHSIDGGAPFVGRLTLRIQQIITVNLAKPLKNSMGTTGDSRKPIWESEVSAHGIEGPRRPRTEAQMHDIPGVDQGVRRRRRRRGGQGRTSRKHSISTTPEQQSTIPLWNTLYSIVTATRHLPYRCSEREKEAMAPSIDTDDKDLYGDAL